MAGKLKNVTLKSQITHSWYHLLPTNHAPYAVARGHEGSSIPNRATMARRGRRLLILSPSAQSADGDVQAKRQKLPWPPSRRAVGHRIGVSVYNCRSVLLNLFTLSVYRLEQCSWWPSSWPEFYMRRTDRVHYIAVPAQSEEVCGMDECPGFYHMPPCRRPRHEVRRPTRAASGHKAEAEAKLPCLPPGPLKLPCRCQCSVVVLVTTSS